MLRMMARRLSGRSAGEIVRLVIKTATHILREASPAGAITRYRKGAFDRRWGVETARLVNLSALTVDQQRARHGVRYQPSSGDSVSDAVGILGLEPGQYSFIDYGSGKGRVCMVAAQAGFGRVIGIEFSPELCAVAERNFERFVLAGGAPHKPEAVLGDAGAFDPPAGPVLAYFYNPFGPPVLDEVVERLAVHAKAGHPVFACYVDPQHLPVFADWTLLHREAGIALLRAPSALACPIGGR